MTDGAWCRSGLEKFVTPAPRAHSEGSNCPQGIRFAHSPTGTPSIATRLSRDDAVQLIFKPPKFPKTLRAIHDIRNDASDAGSLTNARRSVRYRFVASVSILASEALSVI